MSDDWMMDERARKLGIERRSHLSFAELRDTLYENPGSSDRVALKLAELRSELGLTQTDVAEAVASTQSAISRLERQGDVLLSTLRSYVEATGGTLRIVASYGDHEYDLSAGSP